MRKGRDEGPELRLEREDEREMGAFEYVGATARPYSAFLTQTPHAQLLSAFHKNVTKGRT